MQRVRKNDVEFRSGVHSLRQRGIDCGCGLLKCRAGVRAFTRQLLDILDMLIQRIIDFSWIPVRL